MINKIWSYRNETLYWCMFVSCMLLDWAIDYRVNLLPRPVDYLPDLLLLMALLVLIARIITHRTVPPPSKLYAPLIFLVALALVSTIVNQQNPLNLVFGIRTYFKFLIWFLFLLVVPLKMDLTGAFTKSMVVWAFFQVPTTMVQYHYYWLDRDLVSGTILGTQRLSLILTMVFLYIFSMAVVNGKNRWLGLTGLAFLIPTALGDAKAMVFFFPIAFLLLLWHLRKWVTWRFALISLLVAMSANFLAVLLYPLNSRDEIVTLLKKPIGIIYHQSRYSMVDERVDGERIHLLHPEKIESRDYKDPQKLIEGSKGRSLGRFAGLRFAIVNGPQLSNGGLILGAGAGSTYESFISEAHGAIYKAYPTLELDKIPLTMVLLELGILGLGGFSWLLVVLYQMANGLMAPENECLVPLGAMGIGLCFSLVAGFTYTLFFYSEAFMFVSTTLMAILVKEYNQQLSN